MAVKNYGIHDKWTDLDKLNNVDIKSVDGVIESVKINGEEAGGGGSSDFSTAEVTVNDVNNLGFSIAMAIVENSPSAPFNGIFIFDDLGEPATYTTPLYKGKEYIIIRTAGGKVALSGGITFDEDMDAYLITGDCTITIS